LSTFVSVGNARQPFPRLLEAVTGIAELLPRPVTVQYGHTVFQDARFDCIDFLDMDEFRSRLTDAEIVIAHGGAGTIITALESGKLPIVMPRRAEHGEHVDSHQVELVAELAEKRKVIAIEDANGLRAALARHREPAHGATAVRKETPRLVEMVAADLRALAARK